MFIKRDIAKIVSGYKKFPVIALLGPRQSGKTTLTKNIFKKHTFLDLDDPALRLYAQNDPRGFLRNYENKHGIIIDEFQNVPDLLSYIKIIVDEQNRPGYFVLTGSQNFLMNKAITQSLAGRVGIVTLLPLSIHELAHKDLLPTYDELIVTGSYPRIYSQAITPTQFYPSYIQTYVERDVRMISTISDLSTFQLFLKLCAGRIGQLLNVSELAAATGIDQKTAYRWLSILEASYILFILQPYYKNFNKRLIKTPKIYFFDTGIASYLLGIHNRKDLLASPFKGHLFENLIMSDFYKQYYNSGRPPSLYFWRDQNGRIEVDCIVDKISEIIPVEIKSSETISHHYFDSLTQFNELSKESSNKNYVVYGGDINQTRSMGNIIAWNKAGELIGTIFKNRKK